ncbi:DUF4113 domain-containing protein [Stutzerimonas stutzeri]|uniref:DUF4113 domain-containing protein n=1 Tax=Stutzerimonas stutzeri TaxID=316 RepID=UPI0039BD0C2B
MYGAVETRNPPESGLKWCPPKIGAHHAAIWKKRGDGFGGRLRVTVRLGRIPARADWSMTREMLSQRYTARWVS